LQQEKDTEDLLKKRPSYALLVKNKFKRIDDCLKVANATVTTECGKNLVLWGLCPETKAYLKKYGSSKKGAF
jgi:hypothetical protein